MSKATYFVQECPTCGRDLEIRVEYLGKRVACQHCRGQFVASDPSGAPATTESPSVLLLRRAEELLQLAEQRRAVRAASF